MIATQRRLPPDQHREEERNAFDEEFSEKDFRHILSSPFILVLWVEACLRQSLSEQLERVLQLSCHSKGVLKGF